MASTSASSSAQKTTFKYDVFLSFRGEDTRKTFVDHLYHALHNRGIRTYKDDERIEKGQRISEQLIKSIQDSRFHFIVFSKNYASSSWCLDELVKIMECQKTTEQTAFPIFYDVEPTEVRNQSGAVGEAFAKHVEKEGVGRWRSALKEAASLAGWELKNTVDGHEAKFIQGIVKYISLKPHFINSNIDRKLVGMETRLRGVVSSLKIDSDDDVRMIGIWGMGGGGKTTLARAVFDYISVWFEGKSFVENVREVSKGSLSGLKELQKQILSNVLNDQSIAITSVSDGKNMMEKMMPSSKVLVVLDDVDDTEQLEALAGDRNWFKPGSRIIITTRYEQVLVAKRANFIHHVSLLSPDEAVCLFSRYAFEREIPIQGYEELSGKVVEYAAGLPLTIKVLGSHLCGRSESEWIDVIEQLKRIPLEETLKILELSYNGLKNDEKEIFLDVVCILKGKKKDDAIKILQSCGFNADIGLRVLEQKSLITISDFNRLDFHDHIEEMGMNIVRRMHPDEPNMHSRLWINEEIEDILVNESGTDKIECIRLDYPGLDRSIIMKGLRTMKALRFLHLNQGYHTHKVDEANHYLPHALRFLRKMKGLIYLVQGHRKHKVDEASKYLLDALRSLCWHGYPFRCLPKTFRATKLVNLQMSYSNITQLWEGGERKVLNNLKFLDLSESKLRMLDLSMTPHLEELRLEGCYRFVELHMPFELPNLKYLNLSGSKVSSLNLGLTPNLERLYLKGCDCLQEIHAPVGCLKKLVFLNFDSCTRFEDFNIEKHGSAGLDSIATFEVIVDLVVKCPLHPNNNLPEFRFECKYDELGSSWSGNIEKLISFGPCTCAYLKYVSATICSLQHLRELTLYSSIAEVPKDLWQLESLEKLTLVMKETQHLPDSIYMLKHLKSLELDCCTRLEQLPENICRLECLEKLHIIDCGSLRDIPNDICKMKYLKVLHLRYCSEIEKLPEELGLLECLKELNIYGTGISRLPESIYQLKGLRIFGSTEQLRSYGFTSFKKTLPRIPRSIGVNYDGHS